MIYSDQPREENKMKSDFAQAVKIIDEAGGKYFIGNNMDTIVFDMRGHKMKSKLVFEKVERLGKGKFKNLAHFDGFSQFEYR
jgi:hypothetical protein